MKTINQLILLFTLVTTLSSCSSSDDNNNQNLLTKEYLITINGVIDGNVDPYTFTADYKTDNNHEAITYSVPSNGGGEVIITKTNAISASSTLGLDLSVNEIGTSLTYIRITIKDVEADTNIYEKYFESKTVVYNNTESWGTTKLKVLHNISTGETSVEYEQ